MKTNVLWYIGKKMNNPICKICGHEMMVIFENLFDTRYGYPDYFDMLHCLSCGLYQTNPPLVQEEIGSLYTNYYPYADVDAEKIKTGFRPSLGLTSRFKNWLIGNHRIQNMLPKGSGKALEVGCGDGRSLLQLKALGYEACGIDADENIRAIAEKLGLNIHIGTIEDADFKLSTFDLIIANQLIEHIVDLDSFLSKTKSFLKDDGTIILSTPNANSLYRKIFRKTWINWHVPFHQQIFIRKSLEQLLEKYGLKIIKTKTVSPTAWTLHQLEALRHPSKIGERNPYWVVKKVTDHSQPSLKLGGGKGGVYFVVLFIKRFLLRIIVIIITIFNRILDLFGIGDCLVVHIKKLT